MPRLLAGAEAGQVPRACLRDLRCHERAPQGTVGPFLQLCLYETRGKQLDTDRLAADVPDD